MGNLGDALSKRIKSMGIERQVEAVGVVEAAQKEIAKFIPAEDFEVISFNRGTLKIKVNSSSVSNSIHLGVKREFLRKHKIKKIVFNG